jgi:FKBP-type peptidyl-prolyl cis-trans isomerase
MSEPVRTGLVLVSRGRPDVDPPAPARPRATVTVTGLTIEDTLLGQGSVAAPGRTVSVHYTGWLAGGRRFDSSRERAQAFDFELDSGQVIAGWDEGVQGMKVGGRRRLVVPPHLGFGEQGSGHAVPPNSTLVFDVELLAVA